MLALAEFRFRYKPGQYINGRSRLFKLNLPVWYLLLRADTQPEVRPDDLMLWYQKFSYL